MRPLIFAFEYPSPSFEGFTDDTHPDSDAYLNVRVTVAVRDEIMRAFRDMVFTKHSGGMESMVAIEDLPVVDGMVDLSGLETWEVKS